MNARTSYNAVELIMRYLYGKKYGESLLKSQFNDHH